MLLITAVCPHWCRLDSRDIS